MAVDQGIRAVILLILGAIGMKYNFLDQLVNECLGIEVNKE